MKTSRERPKSAPYPRLKNSKKTSKCQVFFYSTRKSKIFRKNYSKNGPSGALGPASASPWRAKRGTLPKLSTFLSQLKGDTFGEKTNFRIKVSQCRKTERGDPLGFFNIHSVAKHQKIEGGKIFIFGKNLTVPKKTERGDPLGFSNIHSVAKQQKIEGGPFGGKNFRKKVSRCRKELEGGTLWSRPVWYVTRENRKNFLVQFAGPNSAIWCDNIL